MQLLEGLNEHQREAVLHNEGPCLVLAGAGSGKTRVLTSRIANLVAGGVPAHQILAITFTNKAAGEMRERVSGLVAGYNGQWIQTFHAACYRILRMDIDRLGYKKDFTIVDDADCKALVKGILKEDGDYQTRPEEMLYIFKQAKNSLKPSEDYFSNLASPQSLKEKRQRIFRLYNARLKESNALDFEDLITLCIRIFREYPDILDKYQTWFRYILIDEYQDTNYAQYMWARLLASAHRNIFAVGDPDQSIYSWRGAEPYNIDRFLNDYPDAKIIKLEANYRSSQHILTAANAVIRNNQERQEKNLYTDRGEGARIVHFCAINGYQEARFIAATIAELIGEKGAKFSDCAIFYRTHTQSRVLEEALLEKVIPYRIVGARRFFERKEIKDIMAYLRLSVNHNDYLSFKRIINVPRRGVGDKTLERIEMKARDEGIGLMEVLADPAALGGINKKTVAALEEFHGMMQYITSLVEADMLVTEILDELLQASRYVDDLLTSDPMTVESRIENLEELKSLGAEFEKMGGNGLGEFLAQAALVQESDDADYSDAVTMMTYHGAKGLEFPVVFMTGMEEGVFPSYRCETIDQLEEERRLCYVGITRAMERLYLTNAVTRFLNGYERDNPPSRFLAEIPSEVLATPQQEAALDSPPMVGDKVRHRKFGVGVVIELLEEDNVAVIDFAHAGTRMLRLDLAPMEKIG